MSCKRGLSWASVSIHIQGPEQAHGQVVFCSGPPMLNMGSIAKRSYLIEVTMNGTDSIFQLNWYSVLSDICFIIFIHSIGFYHLHKKHLWTDYCPLSFASHTPLDMPRRYRKEVLRKSFPKL